MKPGLTPPNSRAVGGYKPREPGSLKQATEMLIAACGGIEASAKLARVGKSTIARYSDPAADDCYIPADVIRALELHCGDPIVTRYLAAEQGCAMSVVKYDPSPDQLADDMGRLADDIACLTKDAMKALATGGDAAPATAARLIADIDQAAAVLFHMRGRLNAGRPG